MKRNIAFIISQFNPKRLNDPIPLWYQYIQKLINSSPTKHISILSPFSRHSLRISNSVKLIPIDHNPIKLYSILRKQNFDELYIVGSYLSIIIYLLLSPRTTDKKIYFVRNRLSFSHYVKVVFHLGIHSFHFFYLLSTINLGWLYRFLVKFNHISTFFFPSKTNLEEFAKDTKIKPDNFKVLLSPIKKFNSRTTLKTFSKQTDEAWIVYAGRASINRRLKLLIDAFRIVHSDNPHTKLILLLLPHKHLPLIYSWLKSLPPSSYHLTTKLLKPAHYAGYLVQSDCLVAPFAFSYDFPSRPATILEAMSLGIPTVISSIVKDNFFRHRYNCLRFENFNKNDLVKKINQILTQPKLKKLISKNAKMSIRSAHV